MGRKKSGLERIVGGLTTGIVVYGLWYFNILSLPWALGLGIVFGALPVLGGLRRAATEISDRGHRKQEAIADRLARDSERTDSLEKMVLQVAKDRQGVVTPALVVLNTDLKLAEAEKVLETLAARGHAEMRIKANGMIDYVFHDLK